MMRAVVPAVDNCPINKLVTVENCEKCPYHTKHWVSNQVVICERLSEEEMKMAREPATVGEPKSRW